MDKQQKKATEVATRYISKMHYLAGSKQNNDHTRSLLGEESAGMTEEQINKATAVLRAERAAIIEWGKSEIWSGILKRMKSKGLKGVEGHEVTLLREVNKILRYSEDEDITEKRETIYECSYGYFERNKFWQIEMEKTYMTMMNLQYNEGTKYIGAKDCAGRGCIARLFSVSNQATMKNINNEVKDVNRQVRKKRTPEQIEEDDKERKGKGSTSSKRLKGVRPSGDVILWAMESAILKQRKKLALYNSWRNESKEEGK